ncbi:hypothetical protein LH128_22250 [Sphingomonas sp. LH128]|uniref:hypothetical protein n=1 Tax=Sphingomonas sp. LH128 TaxID=473781 RepID=UPI00027C9C56|nr:hypothetical protein [Sphingomonas sp. LH128]EJU10765.1 hypothetical protein LH128_22250 [Sphingomonas sp. LH128]
MEANSEMTEWLRSRDLLEANGDTSSLLDLAQHGDKADRDFALSRIAALAQGRGATTARLKSMPGRVPRGGVGTVDLRQDQVQVRRPVLAS